MSKGFLYDEGDELITRKEDVGGLPDTSEASAGDVLSLNSSKAPVWSTPSGGGGGMNLIYALIQGSSIMFADTLDVQSPSDLLTFADLLELGDFYFTIADAIHGVGSGIIYKGTAFVDNDSNHIWCGYFNNYYLDGANGIIDVLGIDTSVSISSSDYAFTTSLFYKLTQNPI